MIDQITTFAGDNDLSRRGFIEGTARAALGVGIGVPFLSNETLAEEGTSHGKAKSLIYIFQHGGMTHLDTFDPKDDPALMGSSKKINTNADPIKLGSSFAELAKVADKFAVINSMSTTTGAHDKGAYIMKCGYQKRGTIVHPTMGPFAEHLLGRRGKVLPDSFVIGEPTSNSGYLDPALTPLPIADPAVGMLNTSLTTDDERFQRRMNIASELGTQFLETANYQGPKSYVEFYDQAARFLKSEELDVFDLSGEKNREDYGMGKIGQGCLLARRLVEEGARVIEVSTYGWDMHSEVEGRIATLGGELAQAVAALITDLDQRGLLESTLVAVGTEFGRSPGINKNAGRDHYPAAFSCMLAGGGIKGGTVHGATDEMGKKVVSKAVRPKDWIATIGHGLGVPLDKEIYSPNGRPFTFANRGRAVTEIYS